MDLQYIYQFFCTTLQTYILQVLLVHLVLVYIHLIKIYMCQFDYHLYQEYVHMHHNDNLHILCQYMHLLLSVVLLTVHLNNNPYYHQLSF